MIRINEGGALVVVAWEEAETSLSKEPKHESTGTYRMRKLLIRPPSTPVTKEGIISAGKDVAAGGLGPVEVEP